MEAHRKLNTDKKEQFKKDSHHRFGSCSSFIFLLILSSMVALAISVLYVEMFQLRDDIDPQSLQQIPEDNTVFSKDEDKTLGVDKKPNIMLSKDKNNLAIKEHLEAEEKNILNEKLKSSNLINDKLQNPQKNMEDGIKLNVVSDKVVIKSQANDDISNNYMKAISDETKDNSTAQKQNIERISGNRKEDENIKEKINLKKSESVLSKSNLKEANTPNSEFSDIENQIDIKESKDDLFKLYMEVEELTDEILSKDPKNEMIMQLAPHLESTFKDIELDRISGIKEGLLHIRIILRDLKHRIFRNNSPGKDSLIENPTTDNLSTDEDGKEPVSEVIPDPIYIAPLGKEEATSNNKNTKEINIPKNYQSKDKIKSEVDNIQKIIAHLKQESDKNQVNGIKMINEALLQKPHNVELLLLKAQVLVLLSDKEKSNSILEQAINTYHSIIDLAVKDVSLVTKDTLKAVGLVCADKMIFRGFQQKAVQTLQQMIKFFPEDITFKNKLGVVFLTFNDLISAKHIFKESLKLNNNDGFAQVHYGFILKSEGTNLKEAIKYLNNGIQSGAEGTSDGRFYFHLGDSLQRLNQTKRARQVYREGVKKGLFLNQWQRSLYNVDRLTSRPVWTPEETTYAHFFKKLENNWKKIKLEGLAAMSLREGFQPESENLKDTGDWRQFELFARGRKDVSNCAKAPITCSLIEEFSPAAGCKRGQVKFSVMQPDTHVWPHTGPSNCRLRSHLGLVVPTGVEMRVEKEMVTWEEGKVIIFDDSWEHEVWHRGPSLRLILIVDVWHPELSEAERRSLSTI